VLIMRRALPVLLTLCAIQVSGQPLRDADDEAQRLENAEHDPPLVLRDAANPPLDADEVEQAIGRLRGRMREIAQAALTEAERRDAYEELYRRNALIFRRESTERPPERPETVQDAVIRLETLMFEVALEFAPDEAAREKLRSNAPPHLKRESDRPDSGKVGTTSPIYILRQPEAAGDWWGDARVETEALALDETPDQLEEPRESSGGVAEDSRGAAVVVETLVDEKVTVEMHDDATILREVETAQGDVVLLDALHLWIGGAVQYDGQTYSDLLNARSGGDSESDTLMRRGEVIVRSTLYDLGEVKLQYDLDSNVWRDLYYRLANTDRARSFTVGNQTEPMSQENLLGNKFNAAMELAAPTSTFGSYKGMGATLNNWFVRKEGETFFGVGGRSETAISTAVGIYGQDIENTSDTDLALTGRITWGNLREDGSGLHLGATATLRDGDFDRINPRPEIAQADRVVLARFDADRAVVLGGEALYSKGSLHASSEFYIAGYRGGDQDARGAGGFLEVGYYLTGQQRRYRPQWGLWAPLQVGARNIFEVFGRVSYTWGDSDDDASNDLRMITVGGSWYRHKVRTSVNLLYGATDRDIEGEDNGLGASLRVQYLF
jgi:phosphate-selective porin